MRFTREQHERGVGVLDALFERASAALWLMKSDAQTGRPTRMRLKPRVPMLQDESHRKRRQRRKTAHESRRRNRPC